MEFFKYYSYAAIVAELFGPSGLILDWFPYVFGALCFAIIYVFKSVGLFTIAVREGYKNKWMAFIPFFSTYYIGVCGQKNRFFKIDTKKIAIATAVIELVLLGVEILSFLAIHAVDPYLIRIEEDSQFSISYYSLPASFNAFHPELAWAGWCYNFLDYIEAPLSIIHVVGMVVVLNCFFQTYAAKRYFIFTITSIFFPVQGILIFAVRNNKGMRYADYVRATQERMYRQYRDQQNFYQNPYNQNPYSNTPPPYEGEPPQQPPQPDSKPAPEPEDPFSEFGSSKGSEPFDEFKN